jgi:hypothetical protein
MATQITKMYYAYQCTDKEFLEKKQALTLFTSYQNLGHFSVHFDCCLMKAAN